MITILGDLKIRKQITDAKQMESKRVKIARDTDGVKGKDKQVKQVKHTYKEEKPGK